eukprot:1160063-Pelagomonas_calceolata.AAC.5
MAETASSTWTLSCLKDVVPASYACRCCAITWVLGWQTPASSTWTSMPPLCLPWPWATWCLVRAKHWGRRRDKHGCTCFLSD